MTSSEGEGRARVVSDPDLDLDLTWSRLRYGMVVDEDGGLADFLDQDGGLDLTLGWHGC